MKHVFLVTNTLVDQCFRRKKANDPSLVLMRLCQQGVLTAYTSSWCLMTMMYLMDEARGPEGKRIWTKKEILAETASLLSFVTVVEAGNGHFARAFTIGWADWEDAIIHAVAEGHGQIEVVVTNDRKYVNRTKKDPRVPRSTSNGWRTQLSFGQTRRSEERILERSIRLRSNEV